MLNLQARRLRLTNKTAYAALSGVVDGPGQLAEQATVLSISEGVGRILVVFLLRDPLDDCFGENLVLFEDFNFLVFEHFQVLIEQAL